MPCLPSPLGTSFVRARICSAAFPPRLGRKPMSNFVEIRPRELKPALLELDGISRDDGRGSLPPLPGLRREAERDSRRARDGRSRGGEPGLLRGPRAEGRPHLRRRRDQEPRDLLRAPRRRGRRPGRRDRSADRAGLRLGRRVARRPARDRDGAAAAGPGRRSTGTRAGSSTTSATRRTRSRCGTRRRSSRSTSTSTRTSSTTRPIAPPTSRRFSGTSTGASSTAGSRATRFPPSSA